MEYNTFGKAIRRFCAFVLTVLMSARHAANVACEFLWHDTTMADSNPTQMIYTVLSAWTVARRPGRPCAHETAARQNELIDIAARLFLRYGYAELSLQTISREAHVAVRTIYTKFGGKSGLFKAVLAARWGAYFASKVLEDDTKPLAHILADFTDLFTSVIVSAEALQLQRLAIAESCNHPELAHAFYEEGPRRMRHMLERFFRRPDIRLQLRCDVDVENLSIHLINCIIGDQFSRLFFAMPEVAEEESEMRHCRVKLFLRSALAKEDAHVLPSFRNFHAG